MYFWVIGKTKLKNFTKQALAQNEHSLTHFLQKKGDTNISLNIKNVFL